MVPNDTSCSRQGLQYRIAMTIRTRLLAKTLVAVPLRDREMNERYLEVETLAGRALSDAAKSFVRFLIDAIRAGGFPFRGMAPSTKS